MSDAAASFLLLSCMRKQSRARVHTTHTDTPPPTHTHAASPMHSGIRDTHDLGIPTCAPSAGSKILLFG